MSNGNENPTSLFDDLIVPSFELELPKPIEEEKEETEEIEKREEVESKNNEVTPEGVMYQWLVDNELTEEGDSFDGTADKLEEVFSKLPSRLLVKAVDELPEDSRNFIYYAFSLGANATADKLKSFFDIGGDSVKYNLDNEDDAYNYLREVYSKSGLYKNDDDLTDVLDVFKDKGTIVNHAKTLKAENDGKLEEQKQAEIERVKKENELIEEQRKEFASNIKSELDKLEWTNERKQAVVRNLKPDVAIATNKAIQQSAKAIVQLADFMSYFDKEKGEFNLSAFEVKSNSREVEKKKESMQKDAMRTMLNKLGAGDKNVKETRSLMDDLVVK